ncbi:MAG: monovalent cation/H(+) antiporter subunit G [Clostridiales bacterium]|nr:monovalent cation/H(+) antiporter subunit G [Candidatus Crickella caballi]
MTVQEIIAAALMALGFIFMLISALGLFRFPDFYSRLHSTGVGDTLGCMLIVAGMMVMTGLKLITIKILLIPIILFLTSPMATNVIMSAAVHKHDYKNYNEMRQCGDADASTATKSGKGKEKK